MCIAFVLCLQTLLFVLFAVYFVVVVVVIVVVVVAIISLYLCRDLRLQTKDFCI